MLRNKFSHNELPEANKVYEKEIPQLNGQVPIKMPQPTYYDHVKVANSDPNDVTETFTKKLLCLAIEQYQLLDSLLIIP